MYRLQAGNLSDLLSVTLPYVPLMLQIHFISASCENMIDGKGMLPGDVLTASNGKTVEVILLSKHQLFCTPQAQLSTSSIG